MEVMMCGIAGVLTVKSINNNIKERLFKIQKSLLGRGDDSRGGWVNNSNQIIFVHNRLAIQDISSKGDQPQTFNNLTIIYNGEVYNFKELREQLKLYGYVFVSDCDTEVILKAYDMWGKDMVSKLNGQFAFAIWDDNKRELFIARDRYGINPLYYYFSEDEFWFSSSLPSLVKNIGKPHTLDQKSIYCFFSLQSIIPSPNTVFEEYKKLEHGHTATIKFIKNDSKIVFEDREYYFPAFQYDYDRFSSVDETIKQVKEELLRAINYRMISSTDVGIWLSGGLDSSLITAICYKEFGKSLSTFAIGFNSCRGECGNEYDYSRYVAKKLNTKHEEVFVPDRLLNETVKECLVNSNEPMMSNDYIGHYLLAKLTNEHGFKVALTGLGADEAWYGYSWHRDILNKKYNKDKMFRNTFTEYSRDFLGHFLNDKFMNTRYLDEFINSNCKKVIGSSFEFAVIEDLNLIMVEDPIKRADSSGMSNRVEIRAPFLDHNLIDLSLKIPTEIKMNRNIGKYILKKIAEEYFDSSFIYRQKGHFSVPLVKFAANDIGVFCKKVISKENCISRGVFKEEFIKEMIDNSNNSITDMGGNLLWQIASLECWLQQFD